MTYVSLQEQIVAELRLLEEQQVYSQRVNRVTTADEVLHSPMKDLNDSPDVNKLGIANIAINRFQQTSS